MGRVCNRCRMLLRRCTSPFDALLISRAMSRQARCRPAAIPTDALLTAVWICTAKRHNRQRVALIAGRILNGGARQDETFRGLTSVSALLHASSFPYCGQIRQITPLPGICTSGPLAAPTNLLSAPDWPKSRTAP